MTPNWSSSRLTVRKCPCFPATPWSVNWDEAAWESCIYARQASLNRLVAIKMILAGGHAGPRRPEPLPRRRPQAIARLQHPNIVTIYEVGEHEGKPFFSPGASAGGSLSTSKLAGTPAAARREAADLTADAGARRCTRHTERA